MDGDSTLEQLTLSASGLAGGVGNGNLLSLLQLTAAGTSNDTLSDGDLTLFVTVLMHVDGSLVVTPMATGDSFFPELDAAGSLEPPLPLPLLALSGQGLAGAAADGKVDLPDLQLAGGLDAGIELPLLTLDASGQASSLVTGAVDLPLLDAAGSLESPLTWPQFGLGGQLLAGAVAGGSATLPELTLAAVVGNSADAVLPGFSVAARGTVGTAASGHVTLERLRLKATHFQDTNGHGAVIYRVLAVAGTASGGNRVDANVSLPHVSVAGVAVSGATGHATLTVPLLTVHAAGYASVSGTAEVELPALLLDAIGYPATLAVPRTTLALNTQLAAVSEYDALPANSFAQFAGLTLAATPTGIVALQGDTDLGVAINASVVAGITDFGSDRFKRIIGGYVGYRATGEMDLTLIADDHDEYVYRLAPRHADSRLHATRVKFGRGAEARYWQWKLVNLGGADFVLDTLGLHLEDLSRQVR